MPQMFDEDEIKGLLKGRVLRKPPAGLMKGYEREVMEKIHTAKPHRRGAFQAVAAVALGLALAGALVFWAQIQGTQTSSPTEKPGDLNLAAPEKPVVPLDDKTLDEMSRDLFILEMLGEGEGLGNEIARAEVDMEFMAPMTGAGF